MGIFLHAFDDLNIFGIIKVMKRESKFLREYGRFKIFLRIIKKFWN